MNLRGHSFRLKDHFHAITADFSPSAGVEVVLTQFILLLRIVPTNKIVCLSYVILILIGNINFYCKLSYKTVRYFVEYVMNIF